MAKQELKPVGQRSIASMFSSPRVTAGRSGHGRLLPLMEFLDRKAEKRKPIQGCVVDAGLTLEVRERLEATRRDDNRRNERSEGSYVSNHDLSCSDESSWPFQMSSQSPPSQGLQPFKVDSLEKITFREGMGQGSVEECSTSRCQDETPTSTYQRRAQRHAEPRAVEAELLDRSRNQAQTPPNLEIFSGSSSTTFQGRLDLDGHHVQKDPSHHPHSQSVDFIDLTEDEDPGAGEDRVPRKRKRAPFEMCPVCSELFPPHMLQAHVESELDALEMLETKSVPEANEPHHDRWEDQARSRGPNNNIPIDAEWEEPGIKARPRHSLLVLGDEPKCRRQPNSLSHESKWRSNGSANFNHYADGAGWWDEGGVGVDAEAVGSAGVWEGLGSMSFGGML